MPTTVNSQPLTAKPAPLSPPLGASATRNGSTMVSEVNGSTTTLWASDLALDIPGDDKGAAISVYTITDNGDPTLAGTITLPAINIAVNTKMVWDKNRHRDLLPVEIMALRIHGDYVWAADFGNGAIYRINKSKTNGDADIVFFKPTVKGSSAEVPLQFNDIAFQPKDGTHSVDRLWVGDGDSTSTNIYSINLPKGFGGDYNTQVISGFTNMTSLVTNVFSSPVSFFEIVCSNNALWVMTQDRSPTLNPDNCGVIHAMTKDDGSLGGATFIPVHNGATLVANLKPGYETLYIGATDGALYKKDISAHANPLDLPTLIHSPTLEFSHYQMSLDEAGYVWSTSLTDRVNSYSPQGTLSRQYKVTASGITTPNWTSPACLHDKKRVALVDMSSPNIGVFTVDEGFMLGDFDLAFRIDLTIPPSTPVSELPLVAYENGSTSLKYGTSVSATLTDINNAPPGTLTLPPADGAVDILANASFVSLPTTVTTGPLAGTAKVMAEARTTGKNTATLNVNVQLQLPVINPVSDKDNNHTNVKGGFDVRQGKDTPLPDVTITAGPGDAKVDIVNENNTKAKFTGTATSGDTTTSKTVKDANGKPVPDINGGDIVGDITVKATIKGATSQAVAVHILPLADAVVPFYSAAGMTPSQVLDIINRADTGLNVFGHSELGNMSSQTVPAPKTLIKMTLVTSPPDALHFVDNGLAKTTKDSVVRLTDDKGKVMLNAAKVKVEYESGHDNFVPTASYIKVWYDVSGQMGNDESKATWSADPIHVKLPSR